jgi:hypothetical protein
MTNVSCYAIFCRFWRLASRTAACRSAPAPRGALLGPRAGDFPGERGGESGKGRGGNNGPTAAGKRGPNDTVTNVSRRPFTVRFCPRAMRVEASVRHRVRRLRGRAPPGLLLGSLLAPRRPAASLAPRHRITMSAKCRSVPGIHQRSAVGCSAESARQRHRPTMKLSSGEDMRGIRPGLSARR